MMCKLPATAVRGEHMAALAEAVLESVARSEEMANFVQEAHSVEGAD